MICFQPPKQIIKFVINLFCNRIMEDILKIITEYADKAHGDQMRKYTPERYIVHPVRVMKTCQRVTNDICILAAALLHDVLEDTPVQKNELENYLKTLMSSEKAERTIQLVVDLTDVYVKKDYPRLNRRTRKAKELLRLEKTSPDSQTIKYADILDNTAEISSHDPDFARVFLYECRANLRVLNKGNQELYQEAVSKVNDAIEKLKKR
jgi:guanosine-3',5'-bis(diphosphate) 3'-pyrophosphohydrolase